MLAGKRRSRIQWWCGAACVAAAVSGFAQGTAFTYQGWLSSGGLPASGAYDLAFSLFDATNGGNQLGSTALVSGMAVSNGQFSVMLDFGGNFPGTDRWLEIGVRTNGAPTFATLSPRQKFTSAPYAITASNLSGGLPAIQLSGTVSPVQAGSLTNHSDVLVSGLAPGHVLVYGGVVWTNAPIPASASGGPAPSNNIPVALSYSGTNVPVNAALGTHFRLMATNSFLLQNPTGASDAQRLLFEIAQDAAGSRTMALDSAFRLGTDIPMVNLSTNANARDFLTCVCSGTNFYVVGFVRGY